MKRTPPGARVPHWGALYAAAFVLLLALPTRAMAAPGSQPLTSQLTFTNDDPNGQGASTLTVFYGLPQQAQVGFNVTVPVRLVVTNLTLLMSYVRDYNVSLSLSLSTGKVIAGQVGVTAVEAAKSNGTTYLRTGDAWGPVNITLPLTSANTGLGKGEEALGNATLAVSADVWFRLPVNSSRQVQSQGHAGYLLVANGAPPGAEPNFLGFALVVIGALVAAVALLALRPEERAEAGRPAADRKPPGAV